jgi:ABC-type antimicrobial peptide transport system permease subunit
VLRAIPQVVARLDPNLPVSELITLPDQVRDNVFFDRMMSVFATAFALLATLLAAIGLYGVLAYSVVQRTREIGVRMALGADSPAVRRMVLRQVALLTAIGGAIGVAVAIGAGQAARSVLFEVEGYDPMAMIGAAIVLGLVSLAAGYTPALRASRVQPMEALRYE